MSNFALGIRVAATAAGIFIAALNSANAGFIAAGSSLGLTGSNSADFAADTITFGPANFNLGLGSFSILTANPPVAAAFAGGALDYTDLATALAGSPLFTVTDSALHVATLLVTSNTFKEETTPTGALTLTLDGFGVLTLSGPGLAFDNTPGTFTITSN